MVAFFLEVVVRRVFNSAATHWGFAHEPWWLLVKISALLLVTCLLTVKFAGVPLADLGLRGWRLWNLSKRHFFPQIVAITLVVFALTSPAAIKTAWHSHRYWQIAVFIFVPQMVWGLDQELYRGMVQTELVRRWGPVEGILAGNLVFTFGPLHAYHFGLGWRHPQHLWIFAGIFGMGLYFAVVYWRSRNLWIVGLLHGVGDFFIDGLAMVPALLK